MRQKPSSRDLSRHEYRTFIIASAAAGLTVFMTLLVNIRVYELPQETKNRLTYLALGGALYVATYCTYLATVRKQRDSVTWINATISGVGLMLLGLNLPAELSVYYRLVAVVAVVAVSVLSERLPVLLMIIIGTLVPSAIWLSHAQTFLEVVERTGVPVAAILVGETIIRIQNVTRQQVQRLEIINAFSRQIASTLDRKEILSRLNDTIPMAVTTDTYYVGFQEDDEIYVPLFYDDGDYFNEMRVKISGTLSGWVVQHKRELFLPDMRDPIDMDGISVVVAGKERVSLSWIGVPMITNRFKGLIVLASYQPNAFNRSDIELLSNLSQHVAMAFENALIHEDAERRSRLDLMTGVLNHRFFLETLQNMADESIANAMPLSLIMLDVDYFKRYNDTYGHLVGDHVLNLLCDTIRAHIKSTDAIGRWGGEEFVIALPNALGEQAFRVAERIRRTMNEMKITGRVGDSIPAPTVSQGIAEFPLERSNIYDLIDLADQHLYVAKGRGRNQIEPDEISWKAPD